MSESVIVRRILEAYRKRGAYAVKIHGEELQPVTVDILACYKARFIGIEVKDGFDKKATPRQLETLHQIERAGGVAFVAHDVDEAVEVLDAIDKEESNLKDILCEFLNHHDTHNPDGGAWDIPSPDEGLIIRMREAINGN